MSIATQIQRLNVAKSNVKEVVNQDFGFIQNETVSDYATKINETIEEYKKYIPEATVEGTELNVDDAVPIRSKIEPKGNTNQKQLSGKNLLPIIKGSNMTKNGITITVDEDNVITINGTCTTDNTTLTLFNEFDLQAGTYYANFIYLSGSMQNNTNFTRLHFADENWANQLYRLLAMSNGTSSPLVLSDEVHYKNRIIRLNAGEIFNNYKFKVQITKTASDFDYEEYCGGQASPNPDYPQEIKVVTGDNVVKHVGKNLLNIADGTYSKNGITAVVDNGKITLNGTATEISFIQIPFKYEYNGSIYSISANNENTVGDTTDSGNYASLRISGQTTSQAILGNKNATKTFTLNQAFNDLTIRTGTGLTYNNFVLYPQLEIGQPTPYEPNREEEYKLDLWKENEFDCENATVLDALLQESSQKLITSAIEKTTIFKCKKNTKYKISKIAGSRLRVAEFDSIPNVESIGKNFFKKDNANEIIYTTTTGEYLAIGFYCTTSASETKTQQETLESIQIQEAIELCKIGDYEDILFKNVVGDENYNSSLTVGAWYKKGVIDKVVLDGTQNGSVVNTGTNNYYYQFMNLTNLSAGEDSNYIKCSHYFGIGIYNGNTNQGICVLTSHREIRIRYGTEDTISNFKNKLAENNVILYYVQKTPTYTKITDPTLIAQLEALRKAKWFKGVNHWWTETENLEPVLKGTYKQIVSESEGE